LGGCHALATSNAVQASHHDAAILRDTILFTTITYLSPPLSRRPSIAIEDIINPDFYLLEEATWRPAHLQQTAQGRQSAPFVDSDLGRPSLVDFLNSRTRKQQSVVHRNTHVVWRKIHPDPKLRIPRSQRFGEAKCLRRTAGTDHCLSAGKAV
jgi:hypothetical protein